MSNFKAPFYMNIRFYQPGSTNQKKNSAHIRYIATRPGVDLGQEIDSKMELQPDTPEHHIKYAHERPRSHGLFGAGDEEINMGEIQKTLEDHKGLVWRVIISLHGDDAERLDMEKRESWEEVIKQQLPRAAEDMGISETNLQWVAAFHAEVGHPHAHIVFWEKKPKRRMGKLTPHVKNQMRKKFVQKIYSADRDRVGKEKTALRDMMRSKGLTTLREAVDFAREWKSEKAHGERLLAITGDSAKNQLTENATPKQIEELVMKLENVSKLLPKKGRIMMKFMPVGVKDEIRKIAEWLYEQSQFNPLRAKYEEASEILARPYSTQENQLKNAVSNAREDMINRLSQIVLKAASEVGKENRFTMHPDHSKELVEKIKTARGQAPNDQESRLVREMMKKIHLAALPMEVLMKIFNSLDFNFSLADVKKLYANPIDRKEEKLSKSVLYLLKAALGEVEAEQVIRSMGYTAKEVDMMKAFKHTSSDVEALGKVFKVPDFKVRIVEHMAKLLLSCDLTIEEAKKIIMDWSVRSNSIIGDGLLDKILKSSENVVKDAREWGRTPIVNTKEFRELCNMLNIKATYPWRSSKERDFAIRGSNKSIGTSVFKTALRQVGAFVKKAEAEREYEKLRAMRRIKANAEREHEERERGESGRSR